mgnify:CR=1 FL=1|jgi:hypothetical protein
MNKVKAIGLLKIVGVIHGDTKVSATLELVIKIKYK